ncbi:MAG: PQQ-binding-like beta-propeller repeat protein [Planctomycetota bacterium]|nr:PQQ-binding-like beta-propeller repeat protein [Planctomycetota bacterium]
MPRITSLLVISAAVNVVFAETDGVHWPSFRGPQASGIAKGFETPTKWDVANNENIKWKTPIPGLGHSCPVIWGDRVFVTTAVSGKKDHSLKIGLYGAIAPVNDGSVHKWFIYCIDKNSGKILWQRLGHESVPRVKRHTKATHANSTPATDGKHVVTFLGSEGLFCYGVSGKLLWKNDLGGLDSGYYAVPDAQWGFGSSPIIYEDMVIVQCDVQKNSFIAAFNISDGKEIWRTPRKEVPTWGTPTVHATEERTQIIVNGWKHIGSYDAKSGKELWKLKGGGDIPVPTPIVAHGMVFITNAHGRMAPMYAIRLDAAGDISLGGNSTTNKHIAWSTRRNGAYMQTPLAYGEYLYSCTDGGVLKCYKAKTGELVYQNRLPGRRTGFTPSPVAADGKLYFTSELGEVFVLQTGKEFKLLAKNSMGEICMATPAISEGKLYFRTRGHLVCVSELIE